MKALTRFPWRRTIVKTVILVVILVVFSTVVNHPVLNNSLAMTQFENSNELFIVMDMYNRLRSALPVVVAFSCGAYLLGLIVDIHKFNKTRKEEMESV